MKNNINITGNNKTFQYLVEYSKMNLYETSENYGWAFCDFTDSQIHLFDADIKHFRHNNEWYENELKLDSTYIPQKVKRGKLTVYIPNFSVSTYKQGVVYVITANTWINGYKIDLGSHIFKPTETYSFNNILKYGNNEYRECIEFDIIDAFDLVYGDEWIDFRNKICKEPLEHNNTGSLLNVSLYPIELYDNRYMIDSTYNGGLTSINISSYYDYLHLNFKQELDPLQFKLEIDMNSSYNWLLTYLLETYKIDVGHGSIFFEIIIKNKDTAIIGPTIPYHATETQGKCIQYIPYNTLMNDFNIKTFFSTWDAFEEGWSFVASLNIIDNGYILKNSDPIYVKMSDSKTETEGFDFIKVFKEDDDIELLNVVSNEIPITQEIFSRYINGSQKIIDLKDMNINKYNVINKIENKIVQIERPNDSKSNIIQPVFFRVKDSEILTLHPVVTENICINLDNYKSKVKRFILQIDNCRFEQIGYNSYGALFKILGNTLSKELISGTYYILNEQYELVTSGKYNCVR